MAKEEKVRIGVFVCHCGTNIGGVVNVPTVAEYARTLPGVIHAEENLYTCSEEGLSQIREAVKKHDLNRVVVASCTPRTHGELFMNACEAAGLNRYLFEFVNIRDQCSWVHMHEKDRATDKSKDLIRMGVAKAKLLQPLSTTEMDVVRRALIIGGGVAGLTAAQTIGASGFEVDLVEKESELGGMTKDLGMVFPFQKSGKEVVAPLIKNVKGNSRIKVHTSSVVKAITGAIGNFEITIAKTDGSGVETAKTGVIIVAIGASTLEPKGILGYGDIDNVLTQMEFEEKLESGVPDAERIVMVQCAGSRGLLKTYCSSICCMVAIKNAVTVKEEKPETDVVILFRDIVMTGVMNEELYRKAKDLGVRFVRYTPDTLPKISKDPKGGIKVDVHDEIFGRDTMLVADMVVLSVPLVPQETTKDLAMMLKVPTGQEGFFFEAHVKLRPVDFATDGIFLCGTAHGPKGVEETVTQAMGAASRALIPLVVGKVKSQAITSFVDIEACISCGLCISVCPYGAISKKDEKAWVNELLCHGCGTCGASCPEGAITMRGFTDEQLGSQITSAFAGPEERPEVKEGEEFDPRMVGFLCNWCSYAGADLAGVSRYQYPTNIRVIRVMCSGRVDPVMVLEAFKAGADGVLVGGCHIGDCHYIEGNLMAEKKILLLKKILGVAGIDDRRLRLEWVSASEGQRFADVVKDFTGTIKGLGPLVTSETPELAEKIDVLIKELSDLRSRWLLGKKRELVDLGNAYGETLSDGEYDLLVNDIFVEEFERNWILYSLEKSPATVEELSEHTGIAKHRIVDHITHLWGNNQISLAGTKERSPVYKGGEG